MCHSSKDSRLSFGGPRDEEIWNDNRPRAQTNNRVLTTTADAEIFSSESLLKQFVEKDFMLGQYELYFNFVLDSHIPSSTKYGWWKHARENTIKVRYTISAEVVSKVFDIGNMTRTTKFYVNNLNPLARKNTIPLFRKSIARSLNSDYSKVPQYFFFQKVSRWPILILTQKVPVSTWSSVVVSRKELST
jgi:hypothetical protein